MILDRWMPTADAVERHRVVIAAPLPEVFAALEGADLGGPLARAVLLLRVLRAVRRAAERGARAA